MKKLIHGLYLETFSYPSEDDSKVYQAMTTVLGGEKEFKAEPIESHHGSIILKLFFKTRKHSEIKAILSNILDNISAKDLKTMTSEIKKRIDKEGNFHMRFDKQEAYKGKLKVSYKGDVIKIRIKMASYPFSIKQAEKNVREILEKKVL